MIFDIIFNRSLHFSLIRFNGLNNVLFSFLDVLFYSFCQILFKVINQRLMLIDIFVQVQI